MSEILNKLVNRMNDIIIAANEVKVEILRAKSSNFQVIIASSTPAVQETPHVVEQNPVNNSAYESEFQALYNAVHSDRWPQAVNSHWIVDPESSEERMQRGNGIIEVMIEEPLSNLKFLDYGCGDGAVAFNAADKYDAAISVGYDIVNSPNWAEFNKPNAKFTTDFNQVVENGPYDVILLYDVVDHAVGESPQSILLKAKTLLKDTGRIYMRCHPFTSKHATHLYHDLNKAYLHLIFTPEELKKIAPDAKYQIPNNGVTTPLRTYGNYISSSGLIVHHKQEIKDEVESFFKIPRISERIMRITQMNSFPEFQMSLQFIDYILTK